MKSLQPFELAAAELVASREAAICPIGADAAREEFHRYRNKKMASIETGISEWNSAVASAVERVGQQNGLVAKIMGNGWHQQVAQVLRKMDEPLHSDVILSVKETKLSNRRVTGRVRTFGNTTMSENPEFMPTTETAWPMFPYFNVEPGTPTALAHQGLALLANPPGLEDEEANEVGTPIASATYARSPMVSIELRVHEMAQEVNGAFLINWSFRGRQGAMAKIFLDGLLDVPAFNVASTDEDKTPNFWTVLPMRSGLTVVDLKHVGSGFLWFEHADVHPVIW